jgi:hypothetical protein
MNRFSDMAATASRLLADHPGLPEVVAVCIDSTTTGTSPYRFRPAISLQIFVDDELAGVPVWAAAFAAPVRLIRHDGYVQMSTETVYDGHTVLAWDHLDVDAADNIAACLGTRLDSATGSVLDIDPIDLDQVRDYESTGS